MISQLSRHFWPPALPCKVSPPVYNQTRPGEVPFRVCGSGYRGSRLGSEHAYPNGRRLDCEPVHRRGVGSNPASKCLLYAMLAGAAPTISMSDKSFRFSCTRFGHKNSISGCWLLRSQLLRPNHKPRFHPSRAREGGYLAPSRFCTYHSSLLSLWQWDSLMLPMPDWEPNQWRRKRLFRTYELVHRQGGGSPASPANDAARTSIYKIYWQPIYFYIRGWAMVGGCPGLAQEFFARLFEKIICNLRTGRKASFAAFF